MFHNRISPRHVQRQTTTAHLAQTMRLLFKPVDDLQKEIDEMVSNNPAIELMEKRTCPTCHRVLGDHGVCSVCSRPNSDLPDEPVVYVSPREDFYGRSERGNEDLPDEPLASMTEELPEFVLRQISPELKPDDRRIAAYLLSNLDEDGLLEIDLYELVRFFRVPLSRVKEVQHMIQRAEPVGVGSSSPQEALLAQIEVLRETGKVPELAEKIIRTGWELATHRQYRELAHLLDVPMKMVQQAMLFISENLVPYPARAHFGDTRDPSKKVGEVYHRPDIIISYLNDNPENTLVVEIVMPISGTLRINPMFRQAIHEAGTEEQRESWKAYLERADLFIKCLQQRNNTMERLMRRLVSLQRDFIIRGEKYLVPVTRFQISTELEVHESTISRAVAGKAVQLPNRRIIPLSSFFDRSLPARMVLKEIIESEAHPLSDAEIMDLLAERGFPLARRTVAKYRSLEGILSAQMRKPILREI